MSLKTEKAYVQWITPVHPLSRKRHPDYMGETEISAFLTHLAVENRVAHSTQTQALCALLFLYQVVLDREVESSKGWCVLGAFFPDLLESASSGTLVPPVQPPPPRKGVAPRRSSALPAEEFIRRLLLYVLPEGFVRLRYYRLLSNRRRERNLARCRELLTGASAAPAQAQPAAEATWQALLARLTGKDPTLCTVCGQGHLRWVEDLAPVSGSVLAGRSPP